MTDREKVIEGFEMSYRYSNVDEDNTLVPQQLVLEALTLLKTQEPAKAKDAIWPYRGVFGKCGVCNSPLPVIDGIKSKFCCMCGRAVKWE